MPDRVPPSRLRIPLTVLFTILAFPLGLAVWIALGGSRRGDYLRSRWTRAGIGVAVASALPLLAVIAAAALGLTSDPNPNPVGFGLLFAAGAVAGMALVLAGIVAVEIGARRPA